MLWLALIPLVAPSTALVLPGSAVGEGARAGAPAAGATGGCGLEGGCTPLAGGGLLRPPAARARLLPCVRVKVAVGIRVRVMVGVRRLGWGWGWVRVAGLQGMTCALSSAAASSRIASSRWRFSLSAASRLNSACTETASAEATDLHHTQCTDP